MELRVPAAARRAGQRANEATRASSSAALGEFDLAYLDPPYNQHRYEANYHIWETLVAWDAPAHYGVACKRDEVRDGPRSPFNSRRTMPAAIAQVVRDVRRWCRRALVQRRVVDGPAPSWSRCARARGHVEVLAFPSHRYVGARIGIHSPAGERVGTVGRLENLEYVVVSGERDDVRRMVSSVATQGGCPGLAS